MTNGVIFLVMTFALASCNGNDEFESVVGNDQVELQTEDIIARHISIYNSLLTSACVDIRDAESLNENWIDSVSGNLVNGYLADVSLNDKYIISQEWRNHLESTRSDVVISSIDIMPDDIKGMLYDGILDEDFSKLDSVIKEIETSDWYSGLNDSVRTEIHIDLCLIKEVRSCILHAAMSDSYTRSSTGDRMVWSAAMGQLTPDQQKKVLNATLAGIGLVSSPALALAITVVSMFI